MSKEQDGLKKVHNPVLVKDIDYRGLSKISYEYYDRDGNTLKEDGGAFAKIATIGKSTTYWVMSDMNGIVDVDGILKRNKFKKVNYSTFDMYLQYLKTKNKRFLVSARRTAHG